MIIFLSHTGKRHLIPVEYIVQPEVVCMLC
jgi:hypothetical protein